MTQKLEVSLELNDKFISTALGIYVQHKVVELAKVKGYTDEMQAAMHYYLYSNASSSFLWVALVCQDLDKIPMQSNILLNLTEFPARLDALYTLYARPDMWFRYVYALFTYFGHHISCIPANHGG